MKIKTIQIGITDKCNLSCIMCTHDKLFGMKNGVERKAGIMKFSLFKKLINDLEKSKNNIDLIFLTWIGESLLHPQFLEMVEYITRKNEEKKFFKMLSVNTNSTLINREFSEKIVDISKKYKKTKIHIGFSLDSWSDKCQKKVKNGGNCQKIRDEVIFLLEKNRDGGKIGFHITSLVLKENFDEIKEFVNGWSKILEDLEYKFKITCDDEEPDGEENLIIIKRAILPDQFEADRLHYEAWNSYKKNEKSDDKKVEKKVEKISSKVEETFVKDKSKDKKLPKIVRADSISKKFGDEHIFKFQGRRDVCPALWEYPVIHWDGRVTLCCKDNDLKLVVGNIEKNSFDEIWNSGKEINRYRRWMIEGKFYLIPECAPCGNYDVEAIDKKKLESFLNEEGNGELIYKLNERLNNDKGYDDNGLGYRMREFYKLRIDRLEEFKKAALYFKKNKMLKEEKMALNYYQLGFSDYLKYLKNEGLNNYFRELLKRELEIVLNDYFEETIDEYREKKWEKPFLLENLLNLNMKDFLRFKFHGISEEIEKEIDLDKIKKRFIEKFCIFRDMGNFYWNIEEYKLALKFYMEQLISFPDDVATLKQVAFSNYHLKNYDEAEKYCMKVMEKGEDFEMERLLGHIYLEESRFLEAISHFEKSICLDKDDYLSKKGLFIALKEGNNRKKIRNLAIHLMEITKNKDDLEYFRNCLLELNKL